MRITFIVSNCRYISANMHYGSHISWGWSSTECIWTSCQAPQFFSWCDSRNFLHLWRQNHRRILCWPWSRLSTVSCVRSSLRIWGKKTRETSRNISFRNYLLMKCKKGKKMRVSYVVKTEIVALFIRNKSISLHIFGCYIYCRLLVLTFCI